mmetsp:Transcript_9974/g.22681  ORF Transcript_9974/g.22681 Transcript_9974/m.22681 type:complete len:208 (-) Transcript_9974:19-642(-)
MISSRFSFCSVMKASCRASRASEYALSSALTSLNTCLFFSVCSFFLVATLSFRSDPSSLACCAAFARKASCCAFFCCMRLWDWSRIAAPLSSLSLIFASTTAFVFCVCPLLASMVAAIALALSSFICSRAAFSFSISARRTSAAFLFSVSTTHRLYSASVTLETDGDSERVILPGGLVGDLALVPELSPIHVHAKVNARRGESRPQK